MNNFYVYQGIVDEVCRYIGKGKAHRKDDHMKVVRSLARRRAAGEIVKTTHFYNKLTKAWLAGAEISFDVLIDGLSEHEALSLEIELIAKAPTGQLWNTLPGGEGVSSDFAKAMWADADFRARMIAYHSDPKNRASVSTTIKAMWLDDEYRNKLLAKLRSPEKRQRVTDANLERWSDEQFKAKMKELFAGRGESWLKALSDSWTSERKKAHAKFIENKWKDPEYAAKVSAGGKARWADQEYKEQMIAKAKERNSTDEYKDKMKAISQERWSDPAFQAKMKPILEKNRATANSPGIIARRQARFADPEYASKHAEAVKIGLAKGKEARATPDYRAMRATVNKDAWDKRKAIDPEYAAKRGAAIRAGWAKRKARLAAEHQDSQTIH